MTGIVDVFSAVFYLLHDRLYLNNEKSIYIIVYGQHS